MRKNFLALTLCVLIALTCIFTGCSSPETPPSSTQLDVYNNLDGYNEEEQIEKMAEQKEILFAANGVSDYYVLLGDTANEDTKQSCYDMRRILNKMVGADDEFEVTATRKNGGKYISIGDTKEALSQNYDKSGIKDDGFMIKTDSQNNIYILANEENGLSNGIYTMLEDVFGCMFVRDDYDYIPSYRTIYLDKIDLLSNPDFAWRKVFQYEVSENNWYKRIKNNGASGEGVEINAGWGTWCHSVFTFVDPKIYGEQHPEYFVIVDGEYRQLCLTDPDIYPIVEAKMAELIEKDPEKKYWDFSLNDNMDYCKCENCAKVLNETGSMMGTMIPILNRLARRFPDKTISTLAYFYNKKVPQGLTCEDNVNIVVAPIGTGQLYTYKNGDIAKAKEAKELISEWGKVAKSVFVWDYVVNFNHLLLPYPNFDVQKDNHDFYIENNVKAIFHQGSREHTDELSCLRSYVLSRQMWDNNVDTNKLIAKYLKVTYGKAAPYIAEYLDTMNSELKAKAKDLDLYDSPNSHASDYLSKTNVDKYYDLITKAVDAEKDDQAITDRILEIKVNVLYARMTAVGINVFQKKEAFEEFKILADKFNISRHAEVGLTMNEFIETEYPKTLTKINIAIAAIAILPIVIVCGAVSIVILYKKKKHDSKQVE